MAEKKKFSELTNEEKIAYYQAKIDALKAKIADEKIISVFKTTTKTVEEIVAFMQQK